MRRMLDPKKAGLPSTIQFDEAGNRTASKDVKVDGKLKLKSLVSATNPDGDITKELGGGGGTIHGYLIIIDDMIHYEVFTTEDFGGEINVAKKIYEFWTSAKYQTLRNKGIYPSSGVYIKEDKIIVAQQFEIVLGRPKLDGYDIKGNTPIRYSISLDSQVKLAKMY